MHGRSDGRERLRHPRPALYLAVGALLLVVSAQALTARRRDVELGQRVLLSLPQYRLRPRTARLRHVSGHVVRCRQARNVSA